MATSTNMVVLTNEILEKTTPNITATLQDEAGTGIPSSGLDTLTLDLYSISDAAFPIINARTAQNVLNANDVTVDVSGNLVWSLQVLDTQILNSALSKEVHRAVFTWTYNSGADTGRHVIDMTILNLEKVV